MATNTKLLGQQSGNGNLTTPATQASTGSGSSFVVFISCDASATVTAVNDSKGNSYTRVGTGMVNISRAEAFYCQNGVGGSGHTATVTFSGSSFGTAYLIEIPNAGASSLDVSVVGGDSSSPYGIATGTLQQAAEEVLMLFASGTMSGGAYGAGNMTILGKEEDDGSYWASCAYGQTVASTSSFLPQVTGGSDSGALIVMAFKIGGAGPASITGSGALTVSAVTTSGPNAKRGVRSTSGALTIGAITVSGAGSVDNGSGPIAITGSGALTVTAVTTSGTSKRGIRDVGGAVSISIPLGLTVAGTGAQDGAVHITGSGALTVSVQPVVAGTGKRGIRSTSASLTIFPAQVSGFAPGLAGTGGSRLPRRSTIYFTRRDV